MHSINGFLGVSYTLSSTHRIFFTVSLLAGASPSSLSLVSTLSLFILLSFLSSLVGLCLPSISFSFPHSLSSPKLFFHLSSLVSLLAPVVLSPFSSLLAPAKLSLLP